MEEGRRAEKKVMSLWCMKKGNGEIIRDHRIFFSRGIIVMIVLG